MTLRSLTVLVVSVLVVSPAFSQESRATVTGTVTDTSGSVVVGASLRLTNLDTGVQFTATTNSAGQYRVPVPQHGELPHGRGNGGLQERAEGRDPTARQSDRHDRPRLGNRRPR